MLKPDAGRSPAYERFYLSYSMLISTNVVTHHLVHEASEEELEHLLEETAAKAEVDYRRAEGLYALMGLQFGAVQAHEIRGLASARPVGSASDGRIAAKDAILAFQNFNEFVLLFALFEDAVKEMLSFGTGGSIVMLKEPDVMTRLMTLLKADDSFERFKRQIVDRTICRNYRDAEIAWDFFVAIRHLFVHSAGRPTANWLTSFLPVRDALRTRLRGADIAIMDVRDMIDSICPQERQLLLLPDDFVNFFRNFVVAVMEAVYLGMKPRET